MKKNKRVVLILSILLVLETTALIYLLVSRYKKIAVGPPVIMGKIAIVIDDWGYNLNNLHIAGQIQYPFTAAVLPRLAYSKTVASHLHKMGIEVILHLPMEPHERFRLEQNTIMTDTDEQAIKNIIAQDLTDLEYADGVSNHMGSKATEDLRTMSIVFEELKKRNLFFLDSLVSSKSICAKLADKMHIRFIKRDVFLDNKEEVEYIKGQIQKLKARARIYGEAVGIGHDRKITLEALKEVMPELAKEGYKFAFVSELTN